MSFGGKRSPLWAAFIVGFGVCLSGCSHKLTINAPFDKTVGYFEQKYSIRFSDAKQATRYLDYSGMLEQLMPDGENPALGFLCSVYLIQNDSGIFVSVDQYTPNLILSFSAVEKESKKGAKIVVLPIAPQKTSLKIDCGLFGYWKSRRYGEMVEYEIANNKVEFCYCATKVRNVMTTTKQLIKNRDRFSTK
ncbi:MAG: hypothetical protein ABFD69_09575 [Candidatus Sumerlaeia bacterium]